MDKIALGIIIWIGLVILINKLIKNFFGIGFYKFNIWNIYDNLSEKIIFRIKIRR